MNSFGEHSFFWFILLRDLFGHVSAKSVNFEKLTGKHLCRSFLFLVKLHTIKFIEKRLQRRCFNVNFANFLQPTCSSARWSCFDLTVFNTV